MLGFAKGGRSLRAHVAKLVEPSQEKALMVLAKRRTAYMKEVAEQEDKELVNHTAQIRRL